MAQTAVTPQNEPGKRTKKAMMPPVLRGFLWALIGFLLVNTFVIAVDPFRGHPFVTGPSVTLGWVGALVGWLLGLGVYESILLPLMGFDTKRVERTYGWRRYWELATDHKVIGLQYIMFALAGFLIAGAIAMLMRYELMTPYLTVFHYSSNYLTAVGIHGTIMMFSFATVFMVGGAGELFCSTDDRRQRNCAVQGVRSRGVVSSRRNSHRAFQPFVRCLDYGMARLSTFGGARP